MIEIKSNGAADIVVRKPGQTIAVEVETGKWNIKEGLNKVKHTGFDRVVLFAISPMAVTPYEKIIDSTRKSDSSPVELLT
ncbi:MAG: hypothetical protein JSW66_03815 [Phycisphaerales bacterium]|nr:MAG: hypothetical protein JSW66_03815 [Phycisphaerales bacterium]